MEPAKPVAPGAPEAPPGAPEAPPAGRVNLFGKSREELRQLLLPLLGQAYRVDQVYRALYYRNLESFDQLTELRKEDRAKLAELFELSRPVIAKRHLSADGTEKVLFQLADGATIETVDIPDQKRRTLCLSSQAGCALACRFCVTGFWGAGRNLEPGEILAQVFALQKSLPLLDESINLVFMGMGEPLLNLPALRAACEILMEQISWRRITVSTAGVVPGILELAEWPRRPALAISLHAPDQERRSELMPINRKYPLAELIEAARVFPLAPQERITFEYIPFAGFNDSLGDAALLARLLSGLRAKVNLIPLNQDAVLPADLLPSPPEQVAAFQRRLQEKGVLATVRRRRGSDVSAACGQLRSPSRPPRGRIHR
jgi:23S rRNA (adenine2503-C2)-methyltransferase